MLRRRFVYAPRQELGVPALALASDDSGWSVIDAIDFPRFVEGVIRGVFETIVDASVQQMDAYVDQLHELAASIERFVVEEAEIGFTGGDAKRRHDP